MAASHLLRPLRTFFVLLLLLSGLYANAQVDNVYVYGTVKDYNTSKKLDGITVTVFKDGAKLSSVVTSANGKYEFNLDYGYEYKLLFDKPGMVGKNVSINTRSIPEADRVGGLAMNVEMTLFADIPGIDFKLLQQPIGKSKYDPTTHMLAWDLDYTEQIRAEMTRLLKEYDDKKKREASADEQFNKLMEQGNAAMASKDYKKAVESFTDALGLKASDPIATAKLSDAQIKLNELAAADKKEKQYADLIKTADGLLGKKSYEDAKAKYSEASALKDQEAYPKQKIKECDAFIADVAAKAEAEKKAKELNDKFNAAVAAGDVAFKAAKYEDAKGKFTEAAGLKPDEKYPPQQLAAIAAKLDELAKKAEEDKKAKELDDQFNAAVAAGDAAFKTATYDAAKTKYNEALGLKPKEKYPADQLKAIDQKLAELAAKADADKKAKELDEQYQAAIKAGDAAFQSAKYDEAKAKYNDALGVKPKEKYPTDQLAAIDKKLADLAAKADADKKAKELDEQYQAAITAADASFQSTDYDAAKKKYNEALGLKPKEKYPTSQLAAINKALADIAAKAEAEKKAKELDARYQAILEKAEGLFTAVKYEDAKAKFQEALGVKPDEARPKERIVEIDAKLADLARLAEEQRKKDLLDAKYSALIASADKSFDAKKNSDALNDYKNASQLKPDEQYPKDRIAAINDLMDAKAKEQAEKDRLAREQQEKDKQYTALIAKADKDFKAQSYDVATTGYTSALEVKPGEQYPNDQLAAIVALQAKMAAADSEKAAKDAAERARLAEEARLKAEADSLKAVQNADEQARLDEAARKKAEADSLKAAQDAAEKARLAAERDSKANSAAELQASYDKAIAKADAAFDRKGYDQAREAYTEALGVKPDEKYPKDRLSAIDKALADQLNASKDSASKAEQERLAEEERLRKEAAAADSAKAALDRARQARDGQKALDDQYAQTILGADKAMADKNYPSARNLYSQALDIKPKETYPQVKIDQIDKMLAEKERMKRERELAEQQANESVVAPPQANNADNRKEQEAEEFMREAREREEVEKYGRIKRLQQLVQQKEQDNAAKAEQRQEGAMHQNKDYVASSEELYRGSEEMRKRNAAELEAFQQALAQRKADLQQKGQQDSEQAMNAATAKQADIQQMDATRRGEHATKVNAVLEQQQSWVAKLDEKGQAGVERTNVAREEVLQQEGQLTSLNERGNSAGDSQRQQVDLMKEQHQAREKQLVSGAYDRALNEKTKIDNVPTGHQRSFADYNRNQLASQYQQGVTEESYTEGNKVIIRRVVVQGNKADEYSKVIAKWGTFYFKNGQSISEQIWSVNTER